MGIMDFFKKDKGPDYDPNNIKVTDLRAGFILDYDLKSWSVREEYEYDWGNNYFTREFMLDSGDEIVYLHMDDNEEVQLTASKKVKIRAVGEDIPEYIIEHEQPPKKIVYDGKEYYLDRESPGYFSDEPDNEDSWTELISWDYYDKNEEYILSIEQWGDKEFAAAHGKVVKEFEISNILPGE